MSIRMNNQESLNDILKTLDRIIAGMDNTDKRLDLLEQKQFNKKIHKEEIDIPNIKWIKSKKYIKRKYGGD